MHHGHLLVNHSLTPAQTWLDLSCWWNWSCRYLTFPLRERSERVGLSVCVKHGDVVQSTPTRVDAAVGLPCSFVSATYVLFWALHLKKWCWLCIWLKIWRLGSVCLTPNLLGKEILCGLDEGGLVELVVPVLNISTAWAERTRGPQLMR